MTQKEKGCLLSEDSKYNLKRNCIPVCLSCRSWVAFDVVTAILFVEQLWQVDVMDKVL